jgi:hypothetical protein
MLCFPPPRFPVFRALPLPPSEAVAPILARGIGVQPQLK